MNTQLLQKYNVPGPRYTSYPTVPYWDKTPLTETRWKDLVKDIFEISNTSEGISLYIHLPYCESLCTYCGCNTRITVNHKVEQPYIAAVLKEWQLYLDFLPNRPQIRELHLGGGTPTFFSPENLRTLITGLFEKADIHPEHEFGFEAHPASTTDAHLQTLFELGFR
ncbi:MAG TPA: coproporphyrinogen III oxidase, partial [Runella sp.]|nr:coproporphyrinogen III oxidase [Runella sp.]